MAASRPGRRPALETACALGTVALERAMHAVSFMTKSELVSIAKETAADWKEDKAARLAAALAYYTLLSIAPLIVIAVSVAGLVFGEQAARGQIASQLGAVVGPEAGQGIQAIVANAQSKGSGILGSAIGLVVLLFGASGVFGELQAALDTIWEVEPKKGRGFWGVVKDRFFSFTMVLVVAFLLLVSLVLSTALSAMGGAFERYLPGGELVWQLVNVGVSLLVITLLFGLIFKTVPDVKIRWRDVWPGAFVTALLFTIGKFFLGLYLGKSAMASSYGAAGSLVVLIVWVYYAAQIVFLGAEFTQVWARRHGRRIPPSDKAVPTSPASGGPPAGPGRTPEPQPAR